MALLIWNNYIFSAPIIYYIRWKERCAVLPILNYPSSPEKEVARVHNWEVAVGAMFSISWMQFKIAKWKLHLHFSLRHNSSAYYSLNTLTNLNRQGRDLLQGIISHLINSSFSWKFWGNYENNNEKYLLSDKQGSLENAMKNCKKIPHCKHSKNTSPSRYISFED